MFWSYVEESSDSFEYNVACKISKISFKQKMELDIDVNKLKVLEASFKDQRYVLQDKLRKSLPASISATEKKIGLLEQDLATSERTRGADFQMTIMGHKFGLDVDGKPRKQEAGESSFSGGSDVR